MRVGLEAAPEVAMNPLVDLGREAASIASDFAVSCNECGLPLPVESRDVSCLLGLLVSEFVR